MTITAENIATRPTNGYTHTTTEGGETVHHVEIYTFASLFDTTGTALRYTVRRVRHSTCDNHAHDRHSWECDQRAEPGDWAEFDRVLTAVRLVSQAAARRCQDHSWCHALCAKARNSAAFCSTPEEIAEHSAALEAVEDQAPPATALPPGVKEITVDVFDAEVGPTGSGHFAYVNVTCTLVPMEPGYGFLAPEWDGVFGSGMHVYDSAGAHIGDAYRIGDPYGRGYGPHGWHAEYISEHDRDSYVANPDCRTPKMAISQILGSRASSLRYGDHR